VKFRYEEDSEKAEAELNNRWFNGKPIYAELSPVTDFHEACCRQYQMGECPRGGFCNFMHLKPISNSLRRKLYSVKYRKGPTRDDEYGGEMDGHPYGGGGIGRGGYSPEFDNGMMSGIGGGTYYDGSNGRGGHGGGGGGGGRDRHDDRGGRDRSGDRSSKRGRHDRDSGRRRH